MYRLPRFLQNLGTEDIYITSPSKKYALLLLHLTLRHCGSCRILHLLPGAFLLLRAAELQFLQPVLCLLLQFAHNIGKILTSEDLLTSVWGVEYKNDKEILWVSIASLRQKLEEDAHNPHHIVTRSGLGYLMPPLES